MRSIFIILFFLTACSEKIDYSTPAQSHIDEYMNALKDCKDSKNKAHELNKKEETQPVITDEIKSEIPIEQSHELESPKSLESSTLKEVLPTSNFFELSEFDLILGDPSSKVVLVEYFSHTCPHCAYYKKAIFPEIKEKYIDTNKIAYVIREFIGNKQDLDAAVLARCSGNKEDLLKFDIVLLEQQEQWVLSKKYRDILTSIGQLGGVSPDKYTECLNNNNLVEQLIKNTKIASKSPKFVGTPAFFINDVQFTSAYSAQGLSEAIEQELVKVSHNEH